MASALPVPVNLAELSMQPFPAPVPVPAPAPMPTPVPAPAPAPPAPAAPAAHTVLDKTRTAATTTTAAVAAAAAAAARTVDVDFSAAPSNAAINMHPWVALGTKLSVIKYAHHARATVTITGIPYEHQWFTLAKISPHCVTFSKFIACDFFLNIAPSTNGIDGPIVAATFFGGNLIQTPILPSAIGITRVFIHCIFIPQTKIVCFFAQAWNAYTDEEERHAIFNEPAPAGLSASLLAAATAANTNGFMYVNPDYVSQVANFVTRKGLRFYDGLGPMARMVAAAPRRPTISYRAKGIDALFVVAHTGDVYTREQIFPAMPADYSATRRRLTEVRMTSRAHIYLSDVIDPEYTVGVKEPVVCAISASPPTCLGGTVLGVPNLG